MIALLCRLESKIHIVSLIPYVKKNALVERLCEVKKSCRDQLCGDQILRNFVRGLTLGNRMR
jgi:uncharacterized protein YehS (DUF1456 family)